MKMTNLILSFLVFFSLLNVSHSADLPTVEYVNIEQYVGKWYAISALPQIYTINCKSQMAEYKIIDQDSISVLNTCFPKYFGKTTVSGKATILDKNSNSKLVVQFDTWWAQLFGAKGYYFIIKLDPDYKYVMVGEPSLKSLWIMSRTKFMDEEIYKDYVDFAHSLGFEVNKLKKSVF